MRYIPTIGLEIHAELKSATKMFCRCGNDPDEKNPNINVCPVCLGHPGTLPVINQKAVEAVLRLGFALAGTIPKTSKFDRKNYFYPDLPKGYQISQYENPLVVGGYLETPILRTSDVLNINNANFGTADVGKPAKIRIRRIHLEEDVGRLQHSPDGKSSFVDFNRAGVPLLELVTEPDIHSGEEAVRFARELKLILRYLDISDADMEKGEMRIEANISLRAEIPNSESQIQNPKLGTKVEIKNLNSFRSVKDAIDYEIKRQTEILKRGEYIIQETRGWDEVKKQTISQRQKEESHDYRYFPEPDLPPMELWRFNLHNLRESVPELPEQKRRRFREEFDLSAEQAEILVSDKRLADYFEEAASELKAQNHAAGYKLLFNYLITDLLGLMNQSNIGFEELKIKPEHLAHLAALIEKKELTSRMAKDILLKMFNTGLDPHAIIKEEKITLVYSEEIIREAVKEVIAENPGAIADYQKGKTAALQFLIGKSMAKLKGKGNPEVISGILQKMLTNLPL